MKIRRLQKEDLQTRVEWMNNEKVYSSMHFSVPVVMENTMRWFENNIGNDKRADVAFEEDGEIVAFGGLTGVDPTLKKAELYIFVNPKIQAKGYGTKATMQLCEYGFNEMGLHKIYLETNSDNYGAQKVYERCGFKLEGTLRHEYLTKDGEWKDRLYYGKLKDEQ